ncbi:MAG: metalloregulator ArsR/SmtB family transcription factor [Elusimicrobia bacterium]|nr:metalloregulator ArsR/SmtB family transcription factor [Elusimicrobiota bacterium]
MNFIEDSELLKTLGHPLRLKIVCGLMAQSGCNVNDMALRLKAPQSTVSQQLGILRRNGVIAPQKTGVKTCYRIIEKRVEKILEILK